MKLHNSLGKKKQIFRPASDTVGPVRNGISNGVGVYVCGITPYSVTHLGHAFTYTFFDVLLRYLEYTGSNVTYVQNVTDIDDEIVREAKKQGTHWRKLGNKNTAQFLADMRWLGNKQPGLYVRASDHIPEMQSIIKRLLKKGIAYEKQRNVYFDISKDKYYGKLSRLSKEQMLPIANERGNNPNDPNKKHPLDFVLWQAKKPGEPSWASPWGSGRPGWHIECSAMASKYLDQPPHLNISGGGQPFDIHGGGGDLIFPHHESEIAQSENAQGKPMAKFWMHTGILRYKGEKMSKSLGNLVLIENLKKEYSANIVRLALLSHHYRSVWEYTKKDLEQAKKRNRNLQKVWLLQSGPGKKFDFAKEREAFFTAMNDDIDTPKALKAAEQLALRLRSGQVRRQNTTDAKAFMMQVFHTLGLSLEF